MVKEEYLQVPTLSVDGSNWLYYKARVEWAVGSKGHTGHLSGLEAMPDDPSQGKDLSWKPTATEQKLVSEYPAKFKEWTKDDNYVKQVIAASIPESLFLRVQKEETTKGVWDALTNLFQNHSHIVAIDLRHKLQETRCTEKGDLHAHFDKLCSLHEQLATLRQSIGDKDFTAIILGSLLTSYDLNIGAMASSALVSQKDLEPDHIIKGILDEYDRRQTHSKKSTTSTTEDAAYSAKDKKSITCDNCRKKGHTKEQCWQEGGGKAGKGPR